MATRHKARIASRARFKNAPFSAEQMQSLGNALRDSVRDRIRRATDVYDAPAPPLKPHRNNPNSSYAAIKVRRFGGQPIRDWWRTGRTLRSLHVLTVSINRVVVGFTDSVSNFRAFINNRRHRQFGMSPQDRNNVLAKFFELLRSFSIRRAA